jgi:ABC-type transport system involved in multi-copper enzyme maturation permease subunit
MGTVLTLASATFGEAIRRKILLIFLCVSIAMIVLFFAFAQFNVGEQLVIIKSMGLGIISISGLFISVILGINLIPNEIDKRTIYTILSKPVARWQFIVGKFVGALMTVFVNILAMGIIFLGIVWWKTQAPEFSVIDGVVMIFFQMMLVNAVALMFSVFVTPFVNFFLTFATYIIGSMSSVTESLAMPNSRQNPIVTDFFKIIHFIIPNFGNFNIQNPIIHPDIEIVNMASYMSQNIVLAFIEVLIMMLIAVIIFDRREV